MIHVALPVAFQPFLRAGYEGGCLLCQKPVSSHISEGGRWLGCPEGSEQMVFVLVPVPMPKAAPQEPVQPPAASQPASRRRFRRAAYTAAKEPQTSLAPLTALVFKALSGTSGQTAQDLRRTCGLSANQVQQALKWLKRHELVSAKAAA